MQTLSVLLSEWNDILFRRGQKVEKKGRSGEVKITRTNDVRVSSSQQQLYKRIVNSRLVLWKSRLKRASVCADRPCAFLRLHYYYTFIYWNCCFFFLFLSFHAVHLSASFQVYAKCIHIISHSRHSPKVVGSAKRFWTFSPVSSAPIQPKSTSAASKPARWPLIMKRCQSIIG